MWGCTWNDPSYSAKSSGRHKLPPVPSFSKRRGFEVAGTRCAEDDDADDDDDDDDVDDVDGVDEVDDHHDFDNCNLIIDGGKYEDVEYEQRRPDGNGDAQGSRVGRKTSLNIFIYFMLITLIYLCL